MLTSRIGKRKAVGNRADLGEGRGEAGAHAAHLGREHLAGEQVGLRVRADIGHEVEQHEAGEDERDLASRPWRRSEKRGDEQADGAADEAEDLQPDAADAVGEDHREDDADDQQDVDQRRALGGEDVVRDQVAQAADMVGTAADAPPPGWSG